MTKLQDQVAIVTGAAYGIGFAAARRLAMEGAHVILADIKGHEQAAGRLRAENLTGSPAALDVRDAASVAALVESVVGRLGRIDILVNNAAISAELEPAPFEESDADEWHRIYDVNVVGVFRMCRAVSPHMRARRSGRIINIASGTAFKGSAGMLHYIASKGAILSMTRSLATEFAPDNILVNCVSPGFTLTESVAGTGALDIFARQAVATRLVKRDAMAEDVGDVIYFLASPDARFLTGQTIAADGGSVLMR